MPAPLIYVMGPSGAGKTRLIDYVRCKIDGRRSVAFSHRYITRPLGAGGDRENYIALSPAEFALYKARGLFALEWEAYGFDYGIGIEIAFWLRSGLTVVVDGSRAHFVSHKIDLAPIVPVLVTANRDALRRRLNARGRENRRSIEQRLVRATQFTSADLALVTLDNSGSIDSAGAALLAIIEEHTRPVS